MNNSKKLNGSVGSFKNNGSAGKRGSLASIDANRVAIKSIQSSNLKSKLMEPVRESKIG